uniref:VWFA domain-containing protein n=1 Tax=Romanomermis culicivorax TaxID=13658 RepID=A0A915KHJ1_ROMCU
MGSEKGCQSISYKKLDLMFLLDGSGSVGKKNFPKVLDFVKKVVSRLPIGASETAVGVIQYTLVPKNRSDLNGFKPRNEITLNSVKNRDQLVEKIGKIKYIGGATRIIGAISAAYKQFAILIKHDQKWSHTVITHFLSRSKSLLALKNWLSSKTCPARFLVKNIRFCISWYKSHKNENFAFALICQGRELSKPHKNSRFYYTFTASAKTAGVYECQAVSDSGIVIFSRKIYVLKQMEDDSDLDEDIGGTDIFSPSIIGR